MTNKQKAAYYVMRDCIRSAYQALPHVGTDITEATLSDIEVDLETALAKLSQLMTAGVDNAQV